MDSSKVTIRDVAAHTGLSITTVSHVLNDVPGKRVAEATRLRVRSAAKELQYSPNRMAQGLRTQRSHTIGFLSDTIATGPHAGDLIRGAQDVAGEFGSLLLMLNSGSDDTLEEQEIRALLDRQVDGIVYASMYHRVVTPPTALGNAKVVLLDARADHSGIPSVVPDESSGARGAVEELHGFGHRRIAFINNVDDIPAVHGRLMGYREALTVADLPFDPTLVIGEHDDSAGGYRAARTLLVRQDRPTAIFCFNDSMAMGVYQAAHELGLVVPRDLSVIGFDNLELIAAGLRPGLTTVALPHYEMGAWAMRTLMALIDTDGAAAAEQVALPCPLVRRASVNSPPRV
jgi:LacI family transcriptional regulator